MADYQILCIRRDGSDPGERIDAVGGLFGVISVDVAAGMIERGDTFYTFEDGVRAEVRIEPYRGGLVHPYYLTTSPDGRLPNNLLHLPECG